MTNQLQKRLKMLNNEHSSLLTQPRVDGMKENLCFISSEYDTDLMRLKRNLEYYNEINKKIRIPVIDNENKNHLSPEELERQKQALIENGRRLSEMIREKRQQNTNNNNDNRNEGNENIERKLKESDFKIYTQR